MKSVGANRWDPETRAGAVSIKSKGRVDLDATKAVANAVNSWAEYQNLSGDVDIVETSAIQGTYDWRSYLHEETGFARRREARANRQKAAERPGAQAPAPAPQNLYA